LDDEDKTVFFEDEVSEDDGITEYLGSDAAKDDTPLAKQEEDVPIYKPKSDLDDVPVYNQNSNLNNKYKTKKKSRRKKKRFGLVVLSTVLFIVLLIGMTTFFKALNTVIIGNTKVHKKDTSLYLTNQTLTVDDTKAIASMGNLERLSFVSCEFAEASFEYIGEISSYLQTLSLENCSGITNWKVVSPLQYLTTLRLANCGLTNEMLNEIDFSNKDYLTEVCLNENKDLSDISKLAEISDSLTKIEVDYTGVVDFSSLSECPLLYGISAAGNGITDMSTIRNNTITHLNLNDNDISDISTVKSLEYLHEFQACRNKITDISVLADHQALASLRLDGNEISDISVLGSCPYLTRLQLSDNKISTLEPLKECEYLDSLYVSGNQLTSLSGLENALKLQTLQASDNKLSDISSLADCTILRYVYLNDNSISDISVLSKSAETLRGLYFNNNKVSDISALNGTLELSYLSFDNNQVTTLDALHKSVSLLLLSAENNLITDLSGISNSTKLKYICLSHNQIPDMSPIANLIPETYNDYSLIDLSSNHISEIKVSKEKQYSYLAIYNNPIKSLSPIKDISGRYLLFSYFDGIDYSDILNSYSHFKVVDCPPDKQVEVEKALGGRLYVQFSTAEEADQETKEALNALLEASTIAENP
jgi:Leucine-rich repeat (LRR) protein